MVNWMLYINQLSQIVKYSIRSPHFDAISTLKSKLCDSSFSRNMLPLFYDRVE